MSSGKNIVPSLPEDLWGLLTCGNFYSDKHKSEAREWVISFIFTKYDNNHLKVSTFVVDTISSHNDGIEYEKNIHKFRQRLRKVIKGNVIDGLSYVVFDLCRALRISNGLGDFVPRIVGSSPTDRLARVLYITFLDFRGNTTSLSKFCEFDGSYVRKRRERKSGPSDSFMQSLSDKKGISIDWLLYGNGVPRPIIIKTLPKIKKRELNDDEIRTGRRGKAQNREDIGLEGEFYVRDIERARLEKAGRQDLAKRVYLVSESSDDKGAGYDVLSFTDTGDEIHIEVKSTNGSKAQDRGFWITENERLKASADTAWCVFRVWSALKTPQAENLGNVVRDDNENRWAMSEASWFVSDTAPP